MNAATLTSLILIHLVVVGMILLTWSAHWRFPGRVNRTSAVTRSIVWAILALALTFAVT